LSSLSFTTLASCTQERTKGSKTTRWPKNFSFLHTRKGKKGARQQDDSKATKTIGWTRGLKSLMRITNKGSWPCSPEKGVDEE
jgi:hypothetical protein